MTWLVRLGAMAAIISLVLEFGFPLERGRELLHGIEVAVVFVFAVDVVLRLALAPDRCAHARQHFMELALLALFSAEMIAVLGFAKGGALARLYLVSAQVYLLTSMLLGLARTNERIASRLARPAWTLVGSFLFVIAIGTGLLLLPNCRAPGARPWTFMDALFTATSATCVTGLSVRDIGSELSFRGQAVVLGLIQVGGLGLVTLTLFITYLHGRAFRLRHATLLQEFWSAQTLGDPGRFLRYILAVTFAVELAGAALLYHACQEPGLEGGGRAWWAAFHSVSAFCNAGLALSPDSFVRYAGSVEVNLTLAALIVLGGLGFPVLANLLTFEIGSLLWIRRLRGALRPRGMPAATRLTLHTRLVLRVTGLLIVLGALLFCLAERTHALSGRGAGESVLASVFQSVTARTAGFNTVDVASLQLPTLLLLILLMTVGASPVSTGGGIRTTTLAVFWLTLRSMLRGRERVDVLGRSIPRIVVNAAVSILFLYGIAVLVTVVLLLATQPREKFIDLLFESVSALSTVGLSTGVTPRLDGWGRGVLCGAMLLGRVGPLAVLWTVVSRPPTLRYQYPEETVVVS